MLYLWMPEGQGQWLWQIDQNGWNTSDSLDQLIQSVQLIYQGKEAIVFFPTQSAQFLSLSLPRTQYKQLGLSGVQYLLEEYVAEPIEQLAIFQDYHHESINMMAISRQLRETYQQSLSLFPWHIQALLPDFLVVPEPEVDTVNIAQVFQHQLIRWSKWRGSSFDDIDLHLNYLPTDTKQINFYDVNHEIEQITMQQLGDSVSYQNRILNELSVAKAKQHPFNILLKSKKASSTGTNYWKAITVLFLLVIIIQVTYDGIRWYKFKTLANETTQLSITQYQQWFPNETRVNEQNLHSQFESKLRMNASADIAALQLISRIGPILQQANVQAEQVKYQEQTLSLSLQANNAQSLNQLAEQFKQQGFETELGSIRNQGEKAIGLIKVK